MRPLIFAAALTLAQLAGSAVAADGMLDPSFATDAEYPGYGFYVNPNGSPSNTLDYLGAIARRPDGKIWVVGRMKSPGAYRLSLYRVQADGYPDVAFGDLGLRTVVAPCTDFSVADAAMDAQGRLLVAINSCADFTVYRFLDNGDLDTSLAGGGALTVPFDQGGTNKDLSNHVMSMPNGDIVIAGRVATATSGILGIARYTEAGLPVQGFGTAGKVQVSFEWSLPESPGVNGLHMTTDGRIVVTGFIAETSQASSDKKQFVVRVLGNGAMDPSFGNVSAGLSKVNLKNVLGVVQSPDSNASMIENDGSIVQVGTVVSNNFNSANDILLLRWRPDGQLDTSIGPSGARQYALDFAGANPADAHFNWESANNIVRQDNGRYVIVAESYVGSYPATALFRLKPDFNLDTSFGTDGKVQYVAQISVTNQHGQIGSAVLLEPGRIVFGGSVFTGTNGRMQMMMGMQHDEIFANTFD